MGPNDAAAPRLEGLGDLTPTFSVTVLHLHPDADQAGAFRSLVGYLRTELDTPGHPDFIAEVERVLAVLDGAILVVSAVEGVQAQTRILLRALRRLRIPTLIFINKTDRRGAGPDRVLAQLNKLAPAVRPGDVEALAEYDDDVLAAYLDGQPAPDRLRDRTCDVTVHPVFGGSAITGAGIGALTNAITDLLPVTTPDPTAPLSGTVFKIERGIAHVRLHAGTLRLRDRVDGGKVTVLGMFDRGGPVSMRAVPAGRIATVQGLDVRVGDAIGDARSSTAHHFPPPALETVVHPEDPRQRVALHAALTELARQDPLIGLRNDLAISLYGEVQKEVVEATLRTEYGIAVTFSDSEVMCVERLCGVGEAVRYKEHNPYAATVGLRVEPGGPGVRFRLVVELGSLPLSFFTAVEESLRDELRHGRRWEVTDCLITMTHSGYFSPVTTAGHFRDLTRVVLRDALAEAGTRVHEPVLRFHLEIPDDLVGTVLPAMTRVHAIPHTTTPDGDLCVVEGEVPAAHVHDLERRLPGLTRGEAVLLTTFDRYQAISKTGVVRSNLPGRHLTMPDGSVSALERAA
ncbi:GTP-binding protein [Actinophytocola algeriensis]|uniref:Ribosomal protection tetracycline resistance protein n=1 Tax=Actinophytocola algeriensis TaxID=1768010 RepID=A0A7W7Q606_9PSEU|nr:GTP-binding protein [Actinophytocola algeriensis]MBB4907716.1 ribosomal protection tetracycline resistance protein [Actinophytocola algeriensis]MBE1479746.1 ribosomal protection tetracycline resistance protein [Actinophytocola algeriensis]